MCTFNVHPLKNIYIECTQLGILFLKCFFLICEGDWQILIREALMRGEDAAELKILKDYALVKEELYRRMPGGVLSKCVGQEKA